jgi:hypothetical protein
LFTCSLDSAVDIACRRLLRVPSPTVVVNPELCAIPAMYRDYRESGRGGRDGGGSGRSHENQRGSRPRAAPGAFEIGGNVAWHRLRPPVYRESTFRGRLLELQFAVHLYGEVHAVLRAIREMSTTSALIALTCNQVTRGLMEIEEWLENLGTTLNDEIGGYVMDLHHGDWTWSNDQDDWVLRSSESW